MASPGEAKHDVFINFGCEDMRYSFVSHLQAAFRRAGISAVDDKDRLEPDSHQFSEETRWAIEKCKVSVVVFSENYAFSAPCLDKLVKVLECRRKQGHAVVPVFYGVNPSIVEQQTGRFEEAFSEHQGSSAFRVTIWRTALVETTTLPGYTSNSLSSDSELVEEIVADVHDKLFPTDKIGIHSRLLEIENSISKQSSGIRIIGIWGTGGIGKTTIAQAAFNQMSGDYEDHCFIEHFDKVFREKGLYTLREEHLNKILKGELDTYSSSRKSSLLRDKLRQKRVLVVLDDVCKHMDAESFLGGFDWFGPGSLLIITSRDKQVLISCWVNQIYEVTPLNKKEALQLCSRCAFGKQVTEKNLVEPLMKVIEYANGNPKAISFYASELKGKKPTEMDTAFQKLKQRPPRQIMDAFRSSYETLSRNEKNVFLDIACFFRGENVDQVMHLLDGCGFFARVGIDILVDKSLLTISEDRLEMHNLIQDLGREIISGETVQIERRRRLWERLSIKYLLEDEEPNADHKRALGTEDIEGVFLDAPNYGFPVNPMAFENMYNLRLLKIYSSNPRKQPRLHLRKGLKSLPNELRLLHWENYPLQSLPQDFDPGRLVEINMGHSQLQRLWEETKNLEMLKTIRLCHSKQLVKLDKLSKARNLELIDLRGCTSLQSFPECPLSIKELCMEGTGIRDIPSTKLYKLKSLELLNLSGCSELKSFPEILETMQNMRYLYLSGTVIQDLHSSISNMIGLKVLAVRNCRYLQKLPYSLKELKNLKIESETSSTQASS